MANRGPEMDKNSKNGKQRLELALLVLLLVIEFAFAPPPPSPTSALSNALRELCVGIKNLVPVAAMLMVVLASVIYASGQIMGAETRARANVWATSCLTGALIGILIATVAPRVLGVINNGAVIDCV
jgi:hypothetical protein